MTSNPRGFLFSIIFIGVAAFIMACGGDDSGGGGDDPLNPNGGSGSNPGAGVDADLRLVGGDPITLDPALAGDAGSAAYIVELFGGLVTIDRDLKIVPDLAEAMPQVTSTGRHQTYTFKIRRDALFHDGRPVTAEDFKYSLEPHREARPDRLRHRRGVPRRHRRRPRHDSRPCRREVSGLKVVDSSTISNHHRLAQAVLPRQADLPDGLRRRQAAG